MTKFSMKDYSIENIKKILDNTMKLAKDEIYTIKEIKKPKKILFLNLKGLYEIEVLKKDEIRKTEFIKTKEQKKEIKSKENNKKIENIKKEDKKNKDVTLTIEELAKKHFSLSKLNIKIVDKKITQKSIKIYLEGKDLYQFNKNKGLENLSNMMNIKFKLKKRIEFISNEDKKREENKIRKYARTIAKEVLETKSEKNLEGFDAFKRRIIHEEMSKFRNIKTKSYGENKERILKVSYIEEKKEG